MLDLHLETVGSMITQCLQVRTYFQQFIHNKYSVVGKQKQGLMFGLLTK